MEHEVRCPLCGAGIEIFGDPRNNDPPTDAVVALQGQWLYSAEYQTPLFVCDPDTELTVIQLATGQLALLPDTEGYPTKHYHHECLCEATSEDEEDDDED